MKKKKEIPVSNPAVVSAKFSKTGQRPSKNTKGDIRRKETDATNPNNGPDVRSRKKSF